MGAGGRRAVVLGLALLSLGGVSACGGGGSGQTPTPPPPDSGVAGSSQTDGGAPAASRAAAAVILAAGDIACDGCAQAKTAALLADLSGGGRAAAILPLGDEAYGDGLLADFEANYAPTWGAPALLALTHPIPGNHEYNDTDAAGYFDYFNGVGAATGIAGTRGQGFYSFDVGAWHIVALNSSDSCNAVACDAGSPQHAWLTADLAAHPARCTLAYWHNPRFQGGSATDEEEEVAPLWDALYDASADVVISGHEHNFQQLAPLDKAGERDDARGIRTFVVGTGGAGFHDQFDGPHAWAMEAHATGTYGVLELTLLDGSYRWRFVGVDGSVPDGTSGSASCH